MFKNLSLSPLMKAYFRQPKTSIKG